jgi:MYXO-CTERM domain-containing protein
MKALAVVLTLLTAAPALATNSTVERKQTTTVERDDGDFGDWGLLGLLGLAGLAGLMRRKTGYTDADYPGMTGYDRKPGP